ncbi:MAG: aspartate/glutamate racemase family protein [Lysobacterales bacterium]|jgi:glutamate racemase
MTNGKRFSAWFVVAVASLFLHASLLADAEPPWLPALLEKEKLTVVVTDSGLGGLSVVADLAEKLAAQDGFREVDLVFVNALFREHGGYNALQTRAEQLAVFSRALDAMAARFDPDLILVACNTLSVLTPDTAFVAASRIPVVGIVEAGVEQIAQRLKADPKARNLMFATRTTVEEGSHLDGLRRLGIGEEQFVAQACPQLTLYIEQGFDAMDTELLIDAYVDEALSMMGEPSGPLTVSFNCTHFGYSLPLWQRAFESRGVVVDAYLDPNTNMADFLVTDKLQGRYPSTKIAVKVVSMPPIQPAAIDSIGRWLDGVSPATAAALRRYQRVEDLFEWRSLVQQPGG